MARAAWAVCLMGLGALAVGGTAASQTAEPRTFDGVTRSVFECVKQKGEENPTNPVEYAPGDAGAARVYTSPVTPEIVLDFVFQEKDESLTFTIVEKPPDMMVTAEMVWSGYDGLIAACQG